MIIGRIIFFLWKLNEDRGKSIVEKGKMKGRDRMKQVGEERGREREKEKK